MSLHRFVAFRKLGVQSRVTGKFNAGHLRRWCSVGAVPRKKGGTLKKIIIGLTATGAAAGGVLAYGNYNPVFKNQVNELIPGFGLWTDKAADVWVNVIDYFSPKHGEQKKGENKDKLVFDYNQAKINQDKIKHTSELTKDQSTLVANKKPKDAEKGGSLSKEQAAKGRKGIDNEGKDKKDASMTGTFTTQKKQVEATHDKGKSETKVTELEKKKPKSPTKSGAAQSLQPPIPPSEGSVSTTIASTSSPKSSPARQETKGGLEGEAPKEQVRKEELQKSVSKGSSAGSKGDLLDPAKVGMMLDETYSKFKLDAERVKKAQQSLIKAWEDLYAKLTSSDSHGDKTVAEAKAATSTAHGELVVATGEYTSSNQMLKELVDRAPKEGFVAKAADIASDMRVKEAEVDLGLVLVKEIVANAEVVEHCRGMIQENKDKLQKDLEALIDPERKDSILLSMNKKVELLDSRLKEVELDHAQKLTLALEVQKRNLEKLSEEKLKGVLDKLDAKYQQRFVKEVNELADNYNGMLREQLRLENESHTKEMAKALQGQADHLNLAWSSEVDLKLLQQQGFYQTELVKAKTRLGGLESMVDGITSAGERTLHLQTLRNSCDTLTGALERANHDPTDRHTIGREVDSLRRAAGEDPFIITVLDSIPSQAVSGVGIQSEASLEERFVKVKRVSKRVALVPESGGGIGTYALSYIQSLLTIHGWLHDVSADKEPSDMHAYDLLRLADGCMKKGDLEGVVYYLNHLHGEPMNIARDWLKDARLYLETKQAILLVQAYMSANGTVTTTN